jgi:hypothetical protein
METRFADRIRLESDKLMRYTQTILVRGLSGYYPQGKSNADKAGINENGT